MDNKEIYNYKLNFYTISPLHIGTGEDIEPFSYVIKNGILYYFDLTKFILMLDDMKRNELLKRISNPGSTAIISVRKYLSDLFDPEIYKEVILYSYKLNQFVEKYYNDRFSDSSKDVINQLAISTIYRNNLYQAIIPGSSIKGMIRNAFVKVNHLEQIEKDIKINKDPFKFVKVSDGIREKETKVDIAFLYHIKKDELELGNTQYSLLEYINSKQSFIVEFSIDLSKNEYSSFNMDYINGISDNFTSWRKIIKMLDDFYKPKFEKLYNIILKYGGEDHPFIENVEKIRKALVGKPYTFIQLGKYGGQEMYNDNGKELENLKYRRYISYNYIKNDADLFVKNLMPLGWIAVYY